MSQRQSDNDRATGLLLCVYISRYRTREQQIVKYAAETHATWHLKIVADRSLRAIQRRHHVRSLFQYCDTRLVASALISQHGGHVSIGQAVSFNSTELLCLAKQPVSVARHGNFREQVQDKP